VTEVSGTQRITVARARLSRLQWLLPSTGLLGWLVLFVGGAGLLLYALLLVVTALTAGELPLGLGGPWFTGDKVVAGVIAAAAVVSGMTALFYGLRGVVRFSRSTPAATADVVRTEARLRRGPHVVAIGGGTGLATLLRGLKHHTSNLTAIVTVADDGGSSGLLRRDMGVLPPGDIRNCLVALADDESLMSRLFQYRFANGGLEGHSFGNLFVAAMAAVTGDFERAVEESTHVLKVRGTVLPATLENVVLRAEMRGGGEVIGESCITACELLPLRISLAPEAPRALPQALAAIAEADLVTLGPGSLFTSVIPNVLIPEVAQALRTTRARVVYVCNVMTQPGETDAFSAADHVEALYRHGMAGLIDDVVVNDTPVSGSLAEVYERSGARPVAVDDDRLAALGVRIVHARVASGGDFFRHDPGALADVVLRLAKS